MDLRCQHKTLKKVQCKRRGTHTHGESKYCWCHVSKLKSQDTCSICFDAMTPYNAVRLETCDHYFHAACLQEWCKRSYDSTCPLCRMELSPGDHVRVFRPEYEKVCYYVSNLPSFRQYQFWQQTLTKAVNLYSATFDVIFIGEPLPVIPPQPAEDTGSNQNDAVHNAHSNEGILS